MDRSEPNVVYGPLSPAAAGELRARSRFPFGETVERAREAIRAEGLWLVQEIDPQALAAREGHRILGARQLLCFHPRYLVRLLETDPAAVAGAPVKILLLELPDGGTLVLHPDPGFGGRPGLKDLAAELSASMARILGALGG